MKASYGKKQECSRMMRFDPFAGEEGAFYYTSPPNAQQDSILEEPVSENVICTCSCHKIVTASDTVENIIPDGRLGDGINNAGKGKSLKENRGSDANSKFSTGRMPLLDSSLNSKSGTSATAIIKHSSENTSSRQAILLPKASSSSKIKQVPVSAREDNPSIENQMVGIGRWLPIHLPLRGQGWRIRKSGDLSTRKKVCQHSDCDISLLDIINQM